MSKTKIMGCLALLTALAIAPLHTASASDKTTNTILGAGIGAAAGAVLSKGDTLATLGGAAAGGVLGNILTEEPRKRRPAAHSNSRHHRYASHPHNNRHVHYAKHGKHSKHAKHHHHGKHHRHR